MKLESIVSTLEQIAPAGAAESWDNVGLLVGDPRQEVSSALLTIDYTGEVAGERESLGCELVIAYHPPIFQAVKKLTASSLVFRAIRDGVAIYSPHTALDVAEGGTNDVLCEVMGLPERRPLKMAETKATQCKLVTFVPAEAVERVSGALFEASAGRIGNYSSCSFRSSGTGTFFGQQGSQPVLGQAGQLEKVEETRLETVVPIEKVPAVVAALRQAHPYEEPAFDLVQLAPPPLARGMGRIGEFDEPIQRAALLERIKHGLGIDHLLVAGPTEGKVIRAAACAGACGDLLDSALSQKADLYLTGEMRHHDALKAARAGLTVVCTLHSNSERLTLTRLKQRLEQALPGLTCHLSRTDRDPFAVR